MTAGRVGWAVFLAVACAAGCGTCEPKPAPPDAAPGPEASAFPFGSNRAHVNVLPPPKPPPSPCRAATVTGGVTLAPLALGDSPVAIPDAGIATMGEVPDDAWIDLARGANLVTRDPRSTREASFVGPARVRGCVDHEEESWVLHGSFEGVPGAGERPGGEEWVMTPAAVVRYSAAGFRLTASVQGAARLVDVDVGKGNVFVWVPEGASVKAAREAGAPAVAGEDGWVRLDEGFTAKVKQLATGKAEDLAAVATDKCEAAAKAAHTLAEQIAAMSGNLGDLAPKHVVARRLARAACGLASLRVTALTPSPAKDTLLVRVREAGAAWQSLAGPPPAPTPFLPNP